MMKHFFERIRHKAVDVRDRPVLIVAFGDSVTQGAMQHYLLDSRQVYHTQWQRLLEEFFPTTTFSTINSGVCGGSALQAVERLDRDILSYQPDLVLIAFGLNDCLGGQAGLASFEEALKAMILKVRKETPADLILLTPPRMAERHHDWVHPHFKEAVPLILKAQSTGNLALYAEAIRRLGKEYAVPVADIHRQWERMKADGVDTDLWLVNGLNHPGVEGHRLAAQVLFGLTLNAFEDFLNAEPVTRRN
jgi:acyl-CoA thioesterase I